MRLTVLLLIVGLLFSGVALSLIDNDNDGFCEDATPGCRSDNCNGTEAGAIVDAFGCSCRQKSNASYEGKPWYCPPLNISGPDAVCIERCGVADFKTLCYAHVNKVLTNRKIECPSDYCTPGGALIDFPESGYEKCDGGKFIEYSCKIQNIAPNHIYCTKALKPIAEELLTCNYKGNKISSNTCLNSVIGSLSNNDYPLYCKCDEGLVDLDSDGYSPYDNVKYDCDDENPSVYIGAKEICDNRIDDDCNGLVNDGCGKFCDVDKDGYYSSGLSELQQSVCKLISSFGISLVGGNDCDDNNPHRNPAAEEKCDYIDNNCDGIGDDKHFRQNKEACDQKDNNCNGEIDEGCECIDGREQIIFGRCRDGKKICRNGRWDTLIKSDDGINEICEPTALVNGEFILALQKKKINIGRQFEISAAFICDNKAGCGDVTAILR